MVLQLKNQIKNIIKSLSCSVKPYLTVCYDEQIRMRQKGDTQMTRNQIEYQRNVETQRSNLAREQETNRANLRAEELAALRDAEQARANRAVETIRSNELAETQRSNQARELETQRSNLARELESNRSNLAREAEDKQWHKAQAQIQAFNAKESQRSNVAREEEANRSNLAKELETQRHNKEQERNATLDSLIQNAHSERQYKASKYQTDQRVATEQEKIAIEREKLKQQMTYNYAALGIDAGFKTLSRINPFKKIFK